MELERRIQLGDFIRDAREAKRLTQRQLGDIIGLSRASVTMIERGHTKFPKVSILQDIAHALEIDEAAIFEVAGVSQPGAGIHPESAAAVQWLANQLDPQNLRRLIAIGHALLQDQLTQPEKAHR